MEAEPSGAPAFEGGIFDAGLEGGRAAATIELGARGVVARTRAGAETALEYAKLSVELGGASGRMVFLRGGAPEVTLYVEQAGFVEALEQHGGSALRDALARARASISRRRAKDRRQGLVLLGCVLVALVGAFYGLRYAAHAAVGRLPTSVDEKLGRVAFQSMGLESEELHDPRVVGAVEAIVERLSPFAEPAFPFRVHVVRDELVNAFALPGGEIVVYTGLIEKVPDGEVLAGVLAHEMAHVTLRHGLKHMASAAGLIAATRLAFGDADGLLGTGAQAAGALAIQKHSRDQERAADREGVRMMHAAGMDPLGLMRFLEFAREEGPELPAFATWLSTHPADDERQATIRAEAQRLGPLVPRPLELDWDAVQAAAR